MVYWIKKHGGGLVFFRDGTAIYAGPASPQHLEQLGHERLLRAARAKKLVVPARPLDPPLTADDLRHNSEWP